MTFDEARRYLISNFEDMNLESVNSVISSLRQEYSPTVLLTKNQYKEFKAAHTLEEKIARLGRLSDASSEDNPDAYINDDMIMRALLFPETIKIIGED